MNTDLQFVWVRRTSFSTFLMSDFTAGKQSRAKFATYAGPEKAVS